MKLETITSKKAMFPEKKPSSSPVEISFSGLSSDVFNHIIHNRFEIFEKFFYEHRLARFERIDWSYAVKEKILVLRLFEEVPGGLTTEAQDV
jgi:hypothetical protein